MIPPLYLQVIVVIGIVIILAIFFHYVLGATLPDAHP